MDQNELQDQNSSENKQPNEEPVLRSVRRRPYDKDKTEIGFNNIMFLLYFPISFIYLEMVLHISVAGGISASFFVYSLIFALSSGLITGVISSLFSKKANYWISIGILLCSSFYFSLQIVYNSFFKDFFYWGLLEVGGNFAQFWENTVNKIFECLFPIILLFLPAIVFAVIGRKKLKTVPLTIGRKIIGIVLSAALFAGGVALINSHDEQFDDQYFYNKGFVMSDAVQRFGVLTALRLDTQYTLFGHGNQFGQEELTTGEITTYDWSYLFGTTTAEKAQTSSPAVDTSSPISSDTSSDTSGSGDNTDNTSSSETTTEEPKPLDTSPNILDIDFASLISKASTTEEKNIHTWYSMREPTYKNEYTGMFEGKNLIFITVESWAPAAINPILTPTLYKMKTEGFVFENYYCSNWGGSTNTGEYAVMTGNYFRRLALYSSSQTYQPFALGNQLSKLGYSCNAFHNGEYTYYDRNLSHPNFGYEWHALLNNSKSVNKPFSGTNGWDVTFSREWPTSDYEMALNTLSYIPLDGSNFHLYYMTISGHPSQTWNSNDQAKKHRDEIYALNLPYTDEYALSYLSCQYEVELMVKTLVDYLDEKGLLDDTVFVMAPDHYPYDICGNDTRNTEILSQLYNLSKDNIFTNPDLYRAPLIIWSASMKNPVTVTKVCSAIDVLPTVSNLFGLEYDSRLIMGHDILSTTDGFVILNTSNGSGSMSTQYWMTDYGYYNIKTGVFTTFPGITVDSQALKASGYIKHYNDILEDMDFYSRYTLYIQDWKHIYNYYGKVFPNGIQ